MFRANKNQAPIQQFQIYGERASGTNYLEHLLGKNFPSVEVSWRYGWKHFFHPDDLSGTDQVLFIVIHRNIYDWLRSLHQTPWHTALELRNMNFSQFIRNPWWCIWDEHADHPADHPRYHAEMMRERDPQTGQRFANVIAMRSAKIKNWYQLRRRVKNYHALTYEDLLAEPEICLQQMARKFSLGMQRAFQPITGFKGGAQTYREKTYPPINETDLRYIRRTASSWWERRAGYRLRLLTRAVITESEHQAC